MLNVVLLGTILRMIDVLRFFDVVYVTTRGGPGDSTMVVTLYAYLQDFQFFQVGVGSAAAVLILLVSIAGDDRRGAAAPGGGQWLSPG